MTCVDVDTQFSLKGDYETISGGFSILASSDQLTVTGYTLSSADIGKYVVVYGAGEFNDGGNPARTSNGNELVSSITAVVGNVATLADTAANDVTAADGGIGTDNAALLIDPLTGDAQVTDNTKYCFSPDKHYFFMNYAGASGDAGFCVRFNANTNVWLEGNGASLYFISSNPNSYAVPSSFNKMTVRNLFTLGSCDKMSFTNFNVYNVGQTQAMETDSNEYGHFNSPPYNRRYNKYANTGMFLYLGQCQNTRIENNYIHECGGLYLHTRLTTNFNKPGEYVSGNIIDQWGFVGALPAGPSKLVNNTFDNSDAPPLSIEQSLGSTPPTLGPSHAIYLASPESDRIIANNVFKNTLGTCIQFNTSGGTGAKGEGILINSNTFHRCMVLMSAIGTVPYKMLFSGNTVTESGPLTIDNVDGDIEISNNTFNLLYTDNTGAIADGSIANIIPTNFNSVFITGNAFKNVENHPYTSNYANILFNLYANSGRIVIQGNFSDLSNYRFIDVPSIQSYSANTRVTIADNDIESTMRFLSGALDTQYGTGDGQSQFNIVNNRFYMDPNQADPGIIDFLGFNFRGNSMINESPITWSLSCRLNDNSFISNCHSNSFQGANCLDLRFATGAIQTRINLIANLFLSDSSTIRVDNHSFRAIDQNYYSGGARTIVV